MRKVFFFLIFSALFFSCGQKQVVYVKPTDAELVRQLVERGIDPCRVYPCEFEGKTKVEVVKVPIQDRGDFIIYPHKEAVLIKPVDLISPEEKMNYGLPQTGRR